jgi:hypothetical protein
MDVKTLPFQTYSSIALFISLSIFYCWIYSSSIQLLRRLHLLGTLQVLRTCFLLVSVSEFLLCTAIFFIFRV